MHSKAAAALNQAAALEALDAAVRVQWSAAAPLKASELSSRFPSRKLLAGWLLPKEAIDAPGDLILAVPELYPNALPLAAVDKNPGRTTLPHVELDGVFCLASSGSLMELPADIRHAIYVVDDAVKLLLAGLEQKNWNDFLDEAATYWTLDQAASAPIWFASTDLQRSRLLKGAAVGQAIVVADTAEYLKKWVDNALPGSRRIPTNDVVFVQLPAPLFPSSYPTHTGELLALVASSGDDALSHLTDAAEPGRNQYVILSFEHAGEYILLGLKVEIPTRVGGDSKGSQPLWHGYRKGNIPKDILLQRIAAAKFPVQRTNVVRVASEFLLRRTAGESAKPLATARIAVIGCGAVGGQVIQLLAQTGVKKLTLVDHDILTWQNVGRHVLPGKYVGRLKADAMREELLSRFPDYEIAAISSKWQHVWKDNPSVFERHDLIISLTADWLSDSLLNRLSKHDSDIPPVVFGWIEAYGLAGHSVFTLPKGGCLRCLTDPVGEFQNSVSSVPPEHGLKKEPSCGDYYQPFSAAAMAPAAAMIVKSALDAFSGRVSQSEHRVWVTSRGDFDSVEAGINPCWHHVLLSGGYERIYRRPVAPQDTCPVCTRYP